METNEYLKQYYERGGEDGRLLSRHGSVEFLTTIRYIEKYLCEGIRIIEIGAGTGRYAHYFAQKSYIVDAVELVDYNIDIFKQNTQPSELVTIKQGNALELLDYQDNSYDITLLLGPMYHLYTEADKLAALSEAIRVTKKNGIIFAAYCNADAAIICTGFMKDTVKNLVNNKMLDPKTFKTHSDEKDVFELYRKEDVDALMSRFDVERLHYVGTDMATNFICPTVDVMDDETFKLYLRYHFSICERRDMIGATHHMLDIFRKK